MWQFIIEKMESNKKIKPEAEEKENARPVQPSQPADTPAEDPSPDMPITAHTPFNSPSMHRLAENKPALAKHPLSEMSGFEKETEIKNSHSVKRLANAQQQLGKCHS